MPVQYEGIRPEHVAVRTGAGMFDVSHMGEIETRGPGAEALLQRLLSNDVTAIAERGAQYSVLCRDDGGVLDDLFTYRLGPERFLTVTNAGEPREGPGLVPRARAAARRRGGGRTRRLGDDRRAGPGGARRAGERWRTGRCRPACAPPSCGWPGVDCLVCGTGYTGEDGAELLMAPDGAVAVWDALAERGRHARGAGRARHAAARGLLPPLRQRPLRGPQPARGRPRLVLQARHGLHRRRTPLRGLEPAETLVPFAFTGPGIPRAGNPVRTEAGEGVVTSGSLSPCLEKGIGMAYVPAGGRRPRHARSRWTCAARRARPRSPRSRCTGRPSKGHRPETRTGAKFGSVLSRRPQVPPRARLGPPGRRGGHVRHHLVRPGRPRRGGVLRPARGGHADHEGPGLRGGRVGEGGVRRVRARSRARSWP